MSIDSFMMTKLHKDIAIHMMQCVQSEEHSDNSTIKEVSKKTKELINNVKGAGTGERQDISRTAAQEEDEPCDRDISVHPGLRRGPH
ncbi:hypothetical protein GBAR_LOCUS27818 [Geodia barretti]|uniref:Uncharacterized protein n=1 Tax=Geodia barretti TaxID=519541 RepID=A0AA35XH83_GEOBA|nr:hypothetical protein GBAR_LOCUS27818 [Geodia barretti]